MPALTLTLNGQNGQPHDWRHVLIPLNQIKTLLNTTKLDYLNLQNYGIRGVNIRYHDGLKGGFFRGYNSSGSALAQDSIIYYNTFKDDGTDEYPDVLKAYAATTAGASRFGIGILTEEIANLSVGNCAQMHEISSIDTSSRTLMSPVYLSTTAGGYSLTLPDTPARIQVIGFVSKVDATAGRIQFIFPGYTIPYSIADEIE